jgi:nitrate reductase gamma subunit
VSRAHGLLFYGFVVLLIGTTLIAIEHGLNSLLRRPATEPLFHKGVYFAVYEIVMEAFGIALLLGAVALARRRVNRPPSLAHGPLDWLVLGALLAIGLTGYAVEGLRIIREQSYLPGFSFVGYLLSRGFYAVGVDVESAAILHWVLLWLHAVLALALIAAFPYTRLLHVIAGVVNLSRGAHVLGRLSPLSLEEVESTGVIGAGQLRDFTRRQLIMLDACVACGRCEDVCPATEVGKPLSPNSIVQDLRGQLQRVGPTTAVTGQMAAPEGPAAPPDAGTPVHDVISSESLWQRVREALGTGAATIAVGCPFCLTMISDGVAAESSDVAVKDVAELLADALDQTTAS